MSKRLGAKIAVLIAVVSVGLVAMGALLMFQQDSLSIRNYTYDMQQEMAELDVLLARADDGAAQAVANYDEVYQSKAASIAFMANNDAGFEVSDAKMSEYRELLGVDNVLIVDRAGTVDAKAKDTKVDFASSRFNRLRTVFDTGEPSDAVEIKLPDGNRWYRYYAAAVSADQSVVIEQNPRDLYDLIEDTESTDSVLRNLSVGEHGYVFSVSGTDYLIEYHPNENLVHADALDAGINVKHLEDGTFTWMTLDGQKLYCGVRAIDGDYYISAVPESDMVASRSATVGVMVFVFFTVMFIVVMYGVFVLREEDSRGRRESEYKNIGPFRFNKRVGGKALALSAIGFLALVAISFYMQTLFSLSMGSVGVTARTDDIAETLARYEAQATALTEQESERNLSKAKVAAYAIDRNAALKDKSKLQGLAQVLGVDQIFVFDAAGTMVATNSPYVNFELSEDPADQSFEFRKLLQGVEEIIQEPRLSEVSGELCQYVGVVLHDEKGDASGFVQISIRPERLSSMLETMQLDDVLGGVRVGADGFAFAVNKESKTFDYFPNDRLVGKNVLEYGMTERQLKDGYSDLVTINGVSYFVESLETQDSFLYVAQPEAALMTDRGPITLTVAALSLVCQLAVFALLSFDLRPRPAKGPASNTDSAPPSEGGAPIAPSANEKNDARGLSSARAFEVTTTSGRRVRTESAASRWLNRSLDWKEKSAEQKTLVVLRWLVTVFAIAMCVAVLYRDEIFGSNSVFAHILSGDWERGLNIFAFTWCLVTVCVAAAAIMALRHVLRILSGVFDARGETICRMLSSFIRYGAAIAVVYWCLAMFGVDSGTLLASAGILSVAISFGAKELVADIISGLFIIFEGEFRVGDIIQVEGYTGTVAEIGVRTCKVEDGSGNIVVLRNSCISDVVNMTKKSSFASCDVGIEYGESLERVENILQKEFPNIRRRLPAIEDGPFYRGVVSLTDNSVNIRIAVQCAEADRSQLERDLNREMKLMFDKYDINIPFPQVVVNQPKEFQEATLIEQLRADQFAEEQKSAGKAPSIEDEDDEDR